MTARVGSRRHHDVGWRWPSIAVLILSATGCRAQPAIAEECQLILDRIVELELAEQGFHDVALAAQKKVQLRSRFATELELCVGRPLQRGALACVRQAHSTEEISHTCLR